ncbi:hypothetical protein Dtox_1835 [Desulfofarcimen acetoxidans DSM 771]|uniref:Nucleotidyl transferase AbiEii/AbiGii toxin family protein n=1 Tax=Desulfofarcimen acetoxidans (strain ATCC 49208 / DSM 771 / KCTC 5769 / VKM B-1644 / 5575) TaxID=485916 RepID=C8VXM7_DESAS|nr:nucleotidyl transferase AbiEii/AbiGii toxin family protein [Desulfofarcimen acetoxidans]ACV62683.1 hypothetical protein Dtox_1835 [Desulfofarcimen acetoxidans DSM 771]
MIKQEAFTEDWINHKANELKNISKYIDPILLEKVTKALYLIECLTKSKMSFIFKGGTAVILLLKIARRFSIDIDIIVEKSVNIEQYLKSVIENNKVFNRFEKDERNKQVDLPVVHYKLFYYSIKDGKENYILLDVLFEENPYMEIIDTNLDCNLIDTVEPIIKINTPSIDCILGDKLTAFAPNTIGIPYGVDKELEIIKQLYDISGLFDVCSNLNVVRETFIKVAQNQINYRGLQNVTFIDVLNDIFETSMIITCRGTMEPDKFKELDTGVRKMRGYSLEINSFIIEEAVKCAAKAAYLSMLLKCSKDRIERFDSRIDLKGYFVNNKLVNSVKKYRPEGFYYWYKAIELRESMEGMLEVAATLGE